MSITLPRQHGLIVRKTAQTEAVMQSWRALLDDEALEFRWQEDDHLIGYSTGMAYSDALRCRLEAAGAELNRDFVETVSTQGVLDSLLPVWLEEKVEPLPYGEASLKQLDADYRRSVEEGRTRTYCMAASSEADKVAV